MCVCVVENLTDGKFGFETERRIWTKCCSRKRFTRMSRKGFWRNLKIWLLLLGLMIIPKYVWRSVQFADDDELCSFLFMEMAVVMIWGSFFNVQILNKRELQVAGKERESKLSSQFRDIATIVMQKRYNPETQRPYTISMIERLMRDIHFAIDPNSSSKKQVSIC